MKKKSTFLSAVNQRILFMGTILMVTAILSSNAMAAKPDFNGKWKLDEAKSELRGERFRPSMTLEVKNDQKNLSVVRVRTGRNGEERKMESVYTLDGKETQGGSENRPVFYTANWSEDGKTLVIHSKRSFTREDQTYEIETSENWTIGEDGNTLIIQSKTSSRRGERSIKLVYNKLS